MQTGGICTAKYMAYVWDKVMFKMENAVLIWIEDQHKKNLPVDTGIPQRLVPKIQEALFTP